MVGKANLANQKVPLLECNPRVRGTNKNLFITSKTAENEDHMSLRAHGDSEYPVFSLLLLHTLGVDNVSASSHLPTGVSMVAAWGLPLLRDTLLHSATSHRAIC